MLLLRLWNYIRGYVIIVVEGYFLEKFINICIHRQIYLWDIKKKKNGVMTLKVSIKGFKLLRPIAGKTNCRVRILSKRGLPFTVNRYKRRKAFVFGAFIFIVIFYALTSFIWNIEIEGNKKIETELIINQLYSYGVKPGVLKYKVDTDAIVNRIMLDIDELAWVEVSLKGTRIKVNVVERKKPPQLIPEDEPCDIVAVRDGVIKSVFVKKGQQMVKPGDTVTAGQVLISGTVVSKNENVVPKKEHSMGVVKARTWYEKVALVDTVLTERERTGTYKDHYSLVLVNKRINLFHKNISFKDYEKIEIKKSLSIGENLIFPFELIIDRFYENNIIEKELELNEAKALAADTLKKELDAEIPTGAEIVKTDVNFSDEDADELSITVTVECLEDIGVAKEIGGN